MTDTEKPQPMVTVKFNKDVQLNGALFKAGWITEVPEDYWLSEGHRHGELVGPLSAGEAVKMVHDRIRSMTDQELERVVSERKAQDALQERRTEEEVPRDGGPGGNLQEGGEGVRPSLQGQEAPGASDAKEDRGEEGLLTGLKSALKSKHKKERS